MKNIEDLKSELSRIVSFIKSYVLPDEIVVVPVSGGLDSDVVARLCVLALGSERVKLFTVHQNHMEDKYLYNVKNLSSDLNVKVSVIELGHMNEELIQMLKNADPESGFDPDSLLDPARANCSLRTAIISSYQDKGFIIAGNSNKSEIELGFFMPFGDNLGHFKPIAHLYKSEVRILANLVHSRMEVIDQSPSAGFWEGENDLEDIAYWIYNGGPISGSKVFSDNDVEQVKKIQKVLSQQKIDECLSQIDSNVPLNIISANTGLSLEIVNAIADTVKRSAVTKNRVLMKKLER